jgi:hypothetical protein
MGCDRGGAEVGTPSTTLPHSSDAHSQYRLLMPDYISDAGHAAQHALFTNQEAEQGPVRRGPRVRHRSSAEGKKRVRPAKRATLLGSAFCFKGIAPTRYVPCRLRCIVRG